MSLDDNTITKFARIVDEAAQSAKAIPMLTAERDFDFADAYRIQRASMARREARGDAIIGLKMGLTSKAKMEQMGVHEPIYGHLSETMRLEDGGVLVHKDHCHPRAEPEIAFLLGRDLKGPVSEAEALAAVDAVVCALEIIDSRYENFKFTLPDVVADNASSAKFVLGATRKKPDAIPLGNLGMVVKQNGVIVGTGSSAAIYEHPARSLAKLAKMLADVGEHLRAGQIVLAGAATKAFHVAPGDVVEVEVDQLGRAAFRAR